MAARVLLLLSGLFLLGADYDGRLPPRVYVNARFGFLVPVPQGWTCAEPDNGDGVWMSSPDGGLRITASGRFNDVDSRVETVDDLRKQYEHCVAKPLPELQVLKALPGGLEGIQFNDFKPGEEPYDLHRVILRGPLLHSIVLSGKECRRPEARRFFHFVCDGWRPIRGIETKP